jgi:hypothetical protein
VKRILLALGIIALTLFVPIQSYASKTSETAISCILSFGFHCIAKYYFVAQNTSNCDLFSGLVSHNLKTGGAKIHFSSPNGSECNGIASPPYYYPPTGGFAGQKGNVQATCNDNRVMSGQWTALSQTIGFGSVTDNHGAIYKFTFGYTANEAIDTINQVRKQLGCPSIETDGVKLRLDGKILKTE